MHSSALGFGMANVRVVEPPEPQWAVSLRRRDVKIHRGACHKSFVLRQDDLE
jgi:hypothetical protein